MILVHLRRGSCIVPAKVGSHFTLPVFIDGLTTQYGPIDLGIHTTMNLCINVFGLMLLSPMLRIIWVSFKESSWLLRHLSFQKPMTTNIICILYLAKIWAWCHHNWMQTSVQYIIMEASGSEYCDVEIRGSGADACNHAESFPSVCKWLLHCHATVSSGSIKTLIIAANSPCQSGKGSAGCMVWDQQINFFQSSGDLCHSIACWARPSRWCSCDKH